MAMYVKAGEGTQWLASAAQDSSICLWDCASGSCGHVLTSHTDQARPHVHCNLLKFAGSAMQAIHLAADTGMGM